MKTLERFLHHPKQDCSIFENQRGTANAKGDPLGGKIPTFRNMFNLIENHCFDERKYF
jgi:hypothetical protein